MATRLDVLKRSNVVKSSIDAVFLRNKLGGEISTDNVLKEPYKKSDLVYICISTTAKAIAQVPIIVGQEVSSEGRTEALPSGDPWQRLFERPNIMADRYSFTEAIITYLMLDGLVYVLPFPMGQSPPDALWVIRKTFIKPMKDQKTGGLLGYYYNPRGLLGGDSTLTNVPEGSIPLNIDEVVRVFFFNPYDPIGGMAPVEAGQMNIVVDYKASFYTSVFFDEGATPGGVLATEQKLGDKQFSRTKEQFEARHQGFKKAHRVAVLEQGLRYTQTGLTQKDMEFKELRGLSAKRIFQVFGMKMAIISETQDVNYATSREQRKEWWEGTNLPIMKMVASALNFILFPIGSKLKATFDSSTIAALKDALKDKVDTGYKLWQMGFTADEINTRLDFGFGTKPWRKIWYQPANLLPVDNNPALSPPTPSPALPPVVPLPALPAPKPPKPPKALIEAMEDFEAEGKSGDIIWGKIMERMAPLEESFAKKTSKVFFEMRKRTLELLYRGTPKTPKDVEDELYPQEHKELTKFSDILYTDALVLGVDTIIEEIGFGITFNITDPEAIAFLSNKNLKIRGIIQTVKNQIQSELVDAYQRGTTIDQMADRIRNVFDVAKSRARTIARTEITGAMAEGRAIALNRSGFKQKEWFTAMDEKVRTSHQAMHGQRINVGESWVLPSGVTLRHPSDYDGPPAEVINCRCIEISVPGSHYLLH